MLEFQSVVFQYDSEDFNIIDGLSFHLEKGEFVSVIGPSGCGKSTIFRLTNQLLPRRSGEILVDGSSTSVWLAGATSARRSFPAACVSVRHSRVRC